MVRMVRMVRSLADRTFQLWNLEVSGLEARRRAESLALALHLLVPPRAPRCRLLLAWSSDERSGLISDYIVVGLLSV